MVRGDRSTRADWPKMAFLGDGRTLKTPPDKLSSDCRVFMPNLLRLLGLKASFIGVN